MGLVFSGSAKRPPQGGEVPALPNFVGSFMLMHTPFYAELPNHVHMVTDMGERLVFRLSVMPPPPNGRQGPSAFQFWGFLSIYAHTLCHRTTKFDVVARGEGACIMGTSAPPIPKQRSFMIPQFWEFSCIYAYTL